jgi:hypothetical protein
MRDQTFITVTRDERGYMGFNYDFGGCPLEECSLMVSEIVNSLAEMYGAPIDTVMAIVKRGSENLLKHNNP